MSSPLSPLMALGLATAATAHGAASSLARGVVDFGSVLRQALAGSDAAAGANPSAAPGESPGTSPDELLASELEGLRKIIATQLEAAGISHDALLAIEVNEFQELQVGTDHPQAWEIERALAENPAVSVHVRRIDELRRLVQAAEAAGHAAPPLADTWRLYVSGPERRLTLA